MAIQYLGTTISGVSGDTKPTLSSNENGVIFIETNTNKMFQWDGGTDTWNEVVSTAASTSNRGTASFSSDNFAVSGGGAVTIKDGGVLLGTETTGNYVQTVAGDNNEIVVSGSTGAVTIGIVDNPTLPGNVTVSGNLTVSGTTTTVDSTNTTITDRLIELASGASSSTADAGIIVERGSTGDNAIMAWDESTDKWIVGTTTATGSSTGDLTITTGTITANLDGAAPAESLSGSTIKSSITGSSLTSVGTLTDLTVSGTTTTIGTVTSGIWNAGAVTSSGDITTTSSFIIGNAAMDEVDLEKLDGITNGTGAANKAVVLDASSNITGIGTIGSGAITSTGTSSFGTGSTIGNLTLANGSITAAGGALDFGNETLTTTGAVDFGAATVDSLTSTGNVSLGDNDNLYIGAGNDLRLWHDASNSYIDENGTGQLHIRTVNGGSINLISGSDYMIQAVTDGAVTLHYDNSPKLATSATGVTVTGDLTSTGNLKVAADGYVWFGDVNHIIDVDAGFMAFKMPADEHFYWAEGGNNIMKLDGTNRRLGIGLNASPDHTLLVYNEALGGTAGNETAIARFGSSSANADSFVMTGRRDANGSDWTTARLKIQRRVDVTDMGYMAFDHPDSGTVLFGNGDTDYFKMLMPTSGEKSFTISSGTSGDAVLYIEADTDDSNEADNPKIVFKQDNGAVVQVIGLTGQADDVATGTIANSMYFKNNSNNYDFHWIAGTEEIMHLDTSAANLMIGRNDTKAGMIQIFGHGTSSDVGGEIQLFTAADHDGAYPYYAIDAHQDDFRVNRYGQTADLLLTAAGNIGVGVADPDQKLEVAGAIHMSGEISSPSAPSDGDGGIMYTKTDGKLYFISNETAEVELSSSGGGGGAGTAIVMAIVFGSTYS